MRQAPAETPGLGGGGAGGGGGGVSSDSCIWRGVGVGERLLEGLYVAVPASGGECARRARRGVSTNKGCARRPQEVVGAG